MPCPFCGSPTRHATACRRAWADRGRRRKLTRELATAAQWLELFGDDASCISPTGRRLFAGLLARVRWLEKELAAARKNGPKRPP